MVEPMDGEKVVLTADQMVFEMVVCSAALKAVWMVVWRDEKTVESMAAKWAALTVDRTAAWMAGARAKK